MAVRQPQPSRYGLVIAAVKFSAMPSCMIFTEPARSMASGFIAVQRASMLSQRLVLDGQ